ncbi:MAG TPA: hypothetical protein VGE86_09315 [Thermoanaerobaculia bacterium]
MTLSREQSAQIVGALTALAFAFTGVFFGPLGLAAGVVAGVPLGWTVAYLLMRRAKARA